MDVMPFQSVTTRAHPSLGLIKYWGKLKHADIANVPATTSIGVSLSSLSTTTTIKVSSQEQSQFILNGQAIPALFMRPMLEWLSTKLPDISYLKKPLSITSHNTFPTAAGLASSSSGIAALALGLSKYFRVSLTLQELSELARIGSGSACRSVFGGFTIWRANTLYAEQIPHSHWSDFRVIILAPYIEQKKISSRDAMTLSANTSPYYDTWVRYNNNLVEDAISAILQKDIEKLGVLIRKSYTAMHACSIAAVPSILYWKADSISLIEHAALLRSQGIPVWETMDAGPQVKLITISAYVDTICESVKRHFPNVWIQDNTIGEGCKVITNNNE